MTEITKFEEAVAYTLLIGVCVPRTCTVDGCDRQTLARGVCSMHYQRFRKSGEFTSLAIPTPIERLLARVVKAPGPLSTNCWFTTYSPGRDGYVRAWSGGINGVQIKAHRLSYEHFVGPIPDGLVLDHLCRVPGCVNPSHVEPVTDGENFLRGIHPSAVTVRTNTCKRGHSMADAYMNNRGHRRCRQCHKITRSTLPRRRAA